MATEFQQRVYDVVLSIPSGSTMTYGQVASALRAKGIPASAQAVGQALRRNPYPIDKPRADGFFVPCHRIVASGSGPGSIGGFAGKREGVAIERKIRLLHVEGVRL